MNKIVNQLLSKGLFFLAVLSCAVPAGAITFISEINPNLTLSGSSYSFDHDISTLGFKTDKFLITGASLTLFFFDNGLGTDDSVEVRLDGGTPGIIIQDPPGLMLEAFQDTLSVLSNLLQSDGVLTVTLFTGNVIFQRSVLEVQAVQMIFLPLILRQ